MSTGFSSLIEIHGNLIFTIFNKSYYWIITVLYIKAMILAFLPFLKQTGLPCFASSISNGFMSNKS